MEAENKKIPLTFMAIDKYVENHVVEATEKKSSGEWWYWGDRNDYPDYLRDLFDNSVTLHSIVTGTRDYVVGNGCEVEGREFMNAKGDTAFDIVRRLALDEAVYGGHAIQVIRDGQGNIAEIYAIPVRFLRTNQDNEVFWYSEKWRTASGRAIRYPKFIVDARDQATAILFSKDADWGVYPIPHYAAAVKCAEIERCIDTYHLNNINNGFMGSYIVNFNNGVPEDSQKKEIEKALNDKVSGFMNAGRILTSFNSDKDHAVTLQKLEVSDYGEKYATLSSHGKQQLYNSFRANPNIFGVTTEANGFNAEEYDQTFKLFNRTVIRPIQQRIVASFDKLGMNLTIDPFTIEGTGETEVNSE